MKGKLYLVATPIGNLEDITLRALNILKEVDIIAAEDTRHTLKLLNHYKISKPLISYYKQIEEEKSEILIEKLEDGLNIAIVSDAGTPGISDPGERIIKKAIEKNIQIIPIPGCCAAINALIISGMSTKEFIFVGFLPVNKKEKREKLEQLKGNRSTMIFYEAPHKLTSTLEDMQAILGDREISISRELTKIHEETIRSNISKIIEEHNKPKGEYVIIVEGNKNNENDSLKILNNLPIQEHYKYYENQGLNKKEIIKRISKDRGVSRNEVYQHFIWYIFIKL